MLRMLVEGSEFLSNKIGETSSNKRREPVIIRGVGSEIITRGTSMAMLDENDKAHAKKRGIEVEFLPGLALSIMLGMIILVATRITFFSAPPSINLDATELTNALDAAVAMSNATSMSQLAQWSIATVLTLSAALVGLNFYTARMSREEERERFTALEQDLSKQLRIQADSYKIAIKELEEREARVQSNMLRLARMAHDANAITTRTALKTRLPQHILTLGTFLVVAQSCDTAPTAKIQMKMTSSGLLDAYESYVANGGDIEVQNAVIEVSLEIAEVLFSLDKGIAERWMKLHALLKPIPPEVHFGDPDGIVKVTEVQN